MLRHHIWISRSGRGDVTRHLHQPQLAESGLHTAQKSNSSRRPFGPTVHADLSGSSSDALGLKLRPRVWPGGGERAGHCAAIGWRVSCRVFLLSCSYSALCLLLAASCRRPPLGSPWRSGRYSVLGVRDALGADLSAFTSHGQALEIIDCATGSLYARSATCRLPYPDARSRPVSLYG